MLLKITYFTTLLLYAGVISQMLFYWIAFSNVTRGMRAEAYIEARQLLDKNLRTNLETLYYLTLLSCVGGYVFA